jgi:adenine-specific DNA glycosylase
MQHKIWDSVDNIESLFSAKTSEKKENRYILPMQENTLPPFPWKLLLNWYESHGRHHLPWRDYTHLEL